MGRETAARREPEKLAKVIRAGQGCVFHHAAHPECPIWPNPAIIQPDTLRKSGFHDCGKPTRHCLQPANFPVEGRNQNAGL